MIFGIFFLSIATTASIAFAMFGDDDTSSDQDTTDTVGEDETSDEVVEEEGRITNSNFLMLPMNLSL